VSANANRAAYESTQAGLAAETLVDAMHANPAAIIGGAYNGAIDLSTTADRDCSKAGCGPLQRAAYDRARAARALSEALPNPKAVLNCAGKASPAGTFDGVCRLEITWTQRALAATKSDSQTLAWVFTP
jgi:Tfp pilus assembly protein PilV